VFGGDVRINPTPTNVLTLDLGPGRYMASASVTFANRSANPHQVNVWFTAVPPPSSLGGPRAAHVDLAPGEVETVALGPAYAVTGDRGTQALVVAQRDGTAADGDIVLAVEGTDFLNRAGATGLTAIGLA